MSATPVNWFLNTTITLSVTFVDHAAACAAVSGGWTAAGAAGAVVCACAAVAPLMDPRLVETLRDLPRFY